MTTRSTRDIIVSPHALTVGEIRRRLIEVRDDLMADCALRRSLTSHTLVNRLDRLVVELRELQRRIVADTAGDADDGRR